MFIAGTFRSMYCESLVIVNHCGLREPRARIKLQEDALLGLIFILHATDRIEGFLFLFFYMSVGYC